MIKILKRLNVLLDGRQKRRMVLIVFLMLIGGILESLSISVALPVMEVVIEPNAITENKYHLGEVYEALGLTKPIQLTVIFMLLLIFAFVLKNLFLFMQTKIQLKFVYSNQFATSRRMMINFMKRPYEYYLGAETSDIQRNITSDVNNMPQIMQSASTVLPFAL